MWLFKKAREGTGDDWAEKIAAELAQLLGLPCARIELGSSGQDRGTISQKFHPAGTSLTHGNELLSEIIHDYPRPGDEAKKQRQVKYHTVEAIFQVFDKFDVGPPPEWAEASRTLSAADMFTGYLMFDSWIGNTDRHHENWASVRLADGRRVLAPTYDHAASMGALLLAKERKARLVTKDRNYGVDAYARRALSALHGTQEESKPMLTIDAFQRAAFARPDAAQFWLEKLAVVSDQTIVEVLSRMPENRMSADDKLFAKNLLTVNKSRLLKR